MLSSAALLASVCDGGAAEAGAKAGAVADGRHWQRSRGSARRFQGERPLTTPLTKTACDAEVANGGHRQRPRGAARCIKDGHCRALESKKRTVNCSRTPLHCTVAVSFICSCIIHT